MKHGIALLIYLIGAFAHAQGAPAVIQMPQLTNMPGTNNAWNQAPAIIFPGQQQQQISYPLQQQQQMFQQNPFMSQDPMFLQQQMQMQQMQQMQMQRMQMPRSPYPMQSPWNQVGNGGPQFSLGLNMPALGDMFSNLLGGDSGGDLFSGLFGGTSSRKRDRFDDDEDDDFDERPRRRRTRVRDCDSCDRHNRRRVTRIATDDVTPRERWLAWREVYGTEATTVTHVETAGGSREIADETASADTAETAPDDTRDTEPRVADTSKARADIRKHTGEPRPIRRGAGDRRDDDTITAADKRRIARYRGNGKTPEAWETFMLNVRACDASCVPEHYTSWGERVDENGKPKRTCHKSGHALDVHSFRCNGKIVEATETRFENLVNCVKRVGDKRSSETGFRMQVQFRDGKQLVSGHNNHAHFSIGCYNETYW